jgi:hypothetical protein
MATGVPVEAGAERLARSGSPAAESYSPPKVASAGVHS